jgi:transposase
MLGGGVVEDIRQMKQDGLSVTKISDLTGFDRKTVTKYLKGRRVPRYGPRQKRASKLDPYTPYIEERLKVGVWNARVLLRELKQRGYKGGYSILKSYLQPRREAGTVVAVRRFETAPGVQAQVDWGDAGTVETEDGVHRLSGFVLTLGHSRAMFADVAEDEKLPTFLRMHEEAFRALGGVPEEILYDRCKTVLEDEDERGELVWNRTFYDFARYWGFEPRVCRGYRPQTKGKVESGIKYLRGNFLCGRSAHSVPDLRDQVRVWTAEVANRRVHGTTHRLIVEALAEELPYLQPLNNRPPYPMPIEAFPTRKVARDTHFDYKTNRYSVSFENVGRRVAVKEVDSKLEVWLEGQRLVEHDLSRERHQVITLEEHVAGIPLGPCGRPRAKNKVHIRPGPPEVEVRHLSQYEAVAQEALAQEAPAAVFAAEGAVVTGAVVGAGEMHHA